MQKIVALTASVFAAFHSTTGWGQLPPPTPAEQQEAEEIAAKNKWEEMVGAYQLCRATDRIAARYRADLRAKGQTPLPVVNTAPCSDPGPFPRRESKPLEASEAHSPAGTSMTAPSKPENEKETRHGQGE